MPYTPVGSSNIPSPRRQSLLQRALAHQQGVPPSELYVDDKGGTRIEWIVYSLPNRGGGICKRPGLDVCSVVFVI